VSQSPTCLSTIGRADPLAGSEEGVNPPFKLAVQAQRPAVREGQHLCHENSRDALARIDPVVCVEEAKGVLGDIDPAQMLAIISLRPSIADIEQASVWLEGDPDVFGPGKAVQGVASEIIAILTENEEEEPRAE
jgi:hypothetical protein